MNDKQESMLRIIRALNQKTVENGCTEAEAMSASAKVGQLLDEYNLSLSEVEVRSESCVQSEIETGRKRNHHVQYCVGAIARFTDTKAWHSWKNHSRSYVFFGLKPDVEAAQYLYNVCLAALEYGAVEACCKGVSQRSSFMLGMASRMSERLSEMKRAKTQYVPVSNDCKAVAVVKQQVIEEQFRGLGIRLGGASSYRPQVNSSDSYYKGKAAGDRVSFNKAVGQTNRSRLLGQ